MGSSELDYLLGYIPAKLEREIRRAQIATIASLIHHVATEKKDAQDLEEIAAMPLDFGSW